MNVCANCARGDPFHYVELIGGWMVESLLLLINLVVLVYCSWIAARSGRKNSTAGNDLGLLSYKNEERP